MGIQISTDKREKKKHDVLYNVIATALENFFMKRCRRIFVLFHVGTVYLINRMGFASFPGTAYYRYHYSRVYF